MRNFKQDFESWYRNMKLIADMKDVYVMIPQYTQFITMPPEMQMGVKLKFFDEQNIFIDVCWETSIQFAYSVLEQGNGKTGFQFKTRLDAFTEAFEKAKIIYEGSGE